MKVFVQFIVLLIFFFACWFALQRIDWMQLLHLEKVSHSTEEKLGDVFWDLISHEEKEIKQEKILKKLDSLVSEICRSNKIDRESIKLHLVKNEQVNAFTLPNRHLVVFTGLILASENESELNGVLGHEIAHMELNHVMKKLIKEVGLSLLISMATGNNHNGKVGETVKLLSSTAFDRSLEREADRKAVEYLKKAKIDPQHFANFLYRLSDEETSKYFSWISTHPDSKERAEYILEERGKYKPVTRPILAAGSWKILHDSLSDYQKAED